MTESKIQDFIKISQIIGSNVAYVQGGGGNTSIKLDNHKMVIKASGTQLKAMDQQKGYSIVDYKSINQYLVKPDIDENLFSNKIKSFVLETKNHPSIETGFHAILGNCVIHTHSVYANILTCSIEGQTIAKKLFPDALWIAYQTPGRDLTIAIKDAIFKSNAGVSIIFLQNHGLIVTADTAQNTLDIHENVNQKIKKYFNLNNATAMLQNNVDLDYMNTHILFPDQVVYVLSGESLLKTTAAKETIWSYFYLLETINKLNLLPNFIPQCNAEILLNMESEKYRQKIITQ